MEQDGPNEPFLSSSVCPKKIKACGWKSRRPIDTTLPTGTALVAMLVAAMLLLFTPIAAESSPCPEQCVCWHWPRGPIAADSTRTVVLTIDCSNGSLQGFQSFMAKEGRSPVAGNSTAKLTLTNGTNDVTYHQNNETLPGVVNKDYVSGHNNLDNAVRRIDLDLSFNNVSSLLALGLHDWARVHTVQTLNLSNNMIETLHPFYFQTFTNLVTLDLSHNVIGVFMPDVFQLAPSLKYLYLKDNQISDIIMPQQQPGDPLPASILVRLDLSYNSLCSLPNSTFSAFPMLSNLDLTDNNIAAIDQFAFTGLPRLQFLFLSHNNLSKLDYPVFQNTTLVVLWLDCMPHLSYLSHDVFQGLSQLQYLNLSQDSQLNFLHHDILSSLQSLQTLDLSGSSIHKLSSLTFRNNLQLQNVYIKDVPLSCKCINAWLVEHTDTNTSVFQSASTLQCIHPHDNRTVPIESALFPCINVSIPNLHPQLSVVIGSSLTLQCKQSFPSDNIVMWTTPRGHNYYYHHFHPNASQHLLSPKDVQPHSLFHKGHIWHQSSSYYAELSSYKERIQVLSDGSLFIDYVLRSDAGSYRCVVQNAHFKDTGSIIVRFTYKISGEVKILACIVGILCAVGIFTLNVIYVLISWLARRLINKRRRDHIRQMLENLNSYKSTQITRIYENYTCQLNRVRNRYHAQRDRLHKNYTMQVDRVKRGCSHQVEKVRDNYNNRLTQLREYSSNQIMQIREMATNQIGRIRDYGSLQIDRLRETYKLQHQHMMKLLDTMNLDNCRSIVETECMRTESMMYDLDLLSQEDVRIESPFSMGDADSEYNTATSSPMLSLASQDLVDPSIQTKSEAGEPYNEVREEYDGYCNQAQGDTRPEEVLKVSRGANTNMRDSQIGEVNPHGADEIQIEMKTVLQCSDNCKVEAKEVWTFGEEDESHRLYTRIRSPKDARKRSQSLLDSSNLPKFIAPREGMIDNNKTPAVASMPTLNSVTMKPTEWDEPLEEEWKGPPPMFHYDGCEDCTTIQLFDSDEEEDEDEEKTENDTMI